MIVFWYLSSSPSVSIFSMVAIQSKTRFSYSSKMEGFTAAALFCLKSDVTCDSGFFKICWGAIVAVAYSLKVFVYLSNWFKKCETSSSEEWPQSFCACRIGENISESNELKWTKGFSLISPQNTSFSTHVGSMTRSKLERMKYKQIASPSMTSLSFAHELAIFIFLGKRLFGSALGQ